MGTFKEDGEDAVGFKADRAFAAAGRGVINFGGRFGVRGLGERGGSGLARRGER